MVASLSLILICQLISEVILRFLRLPLPLPLPGTGGRPRAAAA